MINLLKPSDMSPLKSNKKSAASKLSDKEKMAIHSADICEMAIKSAQAKASEQGGS